MSFRNCSLLLLAAALPLAGQETSNKKMLTARELFYAAVTKPAAQKAAAAKPVAGQPARKAPARKTGSTSAAKSAPVVETRNTPSSQPSPSMPVGLPDGAKVQKAVLEPQAGTPLGLRYTILKKSGDAMVEVAPDTVFHAGDRIQIAVETNSPGYLYIISQGSSGTWKPIFPSPEVEDGNNRVEGWRKHILPPNSRIVFDEQTGVEKLFVVLARLPEADLEKMIYSLQGPRTKPTDSPTAAPEKRPVLVASAVKPIEDSTVGRLRNAYARDLVIEKVDETTPGDRKEKAVYVVNPTGAADARVVADIRLVHQ